MGWRFVAQVGNWLRRCCRSVGIFVTKDGRFFGFESGLMNVGSAEFGLAGVGIYNGSLRVGWEFMFLSIWWRVGSSFVVWAGWEWSGSG